MRCVVAVLACLWLSMVMSRTAVAETAEEARYSKGLELVHHAHQNQGAQAALAKARRLQQTTVADFGADSLRAGHVQYVMGQLYETIGDYPAALRHMRTSLEVAKKVFGPEHAQTSGTMLHLIRVLNAAGDRAAAIEMAKKATDIADANPDLEGGVWVYRFTLAGLLEQDRRWTEAAEVLQEALPVFESRYGKGSVQVADLLVRIGMAQYFSYELETALASYGHALSIAEPIGNTERISSILNNMATASAAKGDFADVDRLMSRAYRLAVEANGADHIVAIATLVNQALLVQLLGDPPRALELAEMAIAALNGHAHPSAALHAARAHGIAGRARVIGDRKRARWHFRKQLDGLEAQEPPADPRLVLHALGDLAGATMESTKAKNLARRALAFAEDKFDADHQLRAYALEVVANATADHGDAIVLHQRALAIRLKANGRLHQKTAVSYWNLATRAAHLADATRASKWLRESFAIEEEILQRLTLTGSEARKRAYLAQFYRMMLNALYLTRRFFPHDAEASQLALEIVLQRKGRLVDLMADTMSRAQLDPAQRTLFAELQRTRSKLAAMMLAERASGTEIAAARATADKLEAQLSTNATSQPRVSEASRVTLGAVQERIPEDAVLIELAGHVPFDEHDDALPARYLAFVVHRSGPPRVVDLGETEPIAALIGQLRHEMGRPDGKPEGAAAALYQRLWSPLVKALAGKRRVFVAPDYTLNLVPFGALSRDGRYILQDYRVSYLSSGRDLLRRPAAGVTASGSLLIGAPNFGVYKPPADGGQGTLSNVQFPPLPGAMAEIEALQALLPDARKLVGKAATEAALRESTSPLILHVATHGFYLPALGDGNANQRSVFLRRRATARSTLAGAMVQSGLAFAGANDRAAGDDGVLTAYEAATLDLRATKLVVLSGCDTGAGATPRLGEELLGLRRSFTVAGAETVVLSLWRVDDDATQALMHAYYQNLTQGQGRADAMREAQLTMLQQAESRHPYFWAAFVVAGDDGPLWPRTTPPVVDKSPRGCACNTPGGRDDGASLFWLLAVALGFCHVRGRRLAPG